MYAELTKRPGQDPDHLPVPGGDQPARPLVFDRAEEQIWPEDGNNDPVFQTAVMTVAKAWRQHGGDLPQTLCHRS